MTPVKTGNFRRNWSISKVERRGNDLVVYLVNPVEYASFVEEGHTHTRGEKKWRVEGFHMARIAIAKVSQNMPADYQREFQKWCKQFGIS
jgi:hypothetical protein